MYTGMFNNMSITQSAINASLLRNKVLSNNIANVDTPEFKRSDVKFEDVLQNILNSDNGDSNIDSQLSDVKPEVVKSNSGTAMRVDGNNVDVENEMAELSKNTIQYYTLIQQMSGSFKKLSMVISGGR